MDIREKQNFFSLLLEAFRLLNRSGAAIFVLLLSVLLVYGAIWGLAKLNVPLPLVKIMMWPLLIFCSSVFLRQLGSKAQNEAESISNSCSAAVFPTIYAIIFLVLTVAALVLSAILLSFTRSLPLAILMYLLVLFLYFRLFFVMPAIVLREQGPIAAAMYSWELTGHRWGTALGLFLFLLFAPTLLLSAVMYSLYVGIPLFFADSFNLMALTTPWYIAGCGLLVLWGLFCIWVACFYVLVFLNLDYGDNRASFTPEEEVRLAAQPTQVFGAQNNILPPGFGKTMQASDVTENLNVQQASLQTHADEVHEHLEQVYTPKQTEHIEYADEDRMPTILFDDEMAKEFEENRQKWAVKQEQKEKPTEPDGGSIKMSK